MEGDLQTNVTMDAEDLMLRQFPGGRDVGRTEQAARWIRSEQPATPPESGIIDLGPVDLPVDNPDKPIGQPTRRRW